MKSTHVLGSYSSFTHHCLVVDLDHLVTCVDLLTLICWRLEDRKGQWEHIWDELRHGFEVDYGIVNQMWLVEYQA